MALLLSRSISRHYPSFKPNTITAKRTLSFKSLPLSSFQQSTNPFMGHHGDGLEQRVSCSFGGPRKLLQDERFPNGRTQSPTNTTTTSNQSAMFESVRSKPPTRKEKRRKGEDERIFNLKNRTNEALSADYAVGSWTLQNISMIRACLEQWLRIIRPNDGIGCSIPTTRDMVLRARERAVWSTKILCRWVDELALGKNPLVSGSELVQVLHRVLHAWKLLQQQLHQQYQQQHSKKDHDLDPRTETCTRALALLQVFRDLARMTNVSESSPLWWPSDKAYTMVLEILSLHPQQAGTMNLAEDLLNERLLAAQKNRQVPLPDLVVWNTCLHVLAKCSPYEKNAPERVEALFHRITSLPSNNGRGGGGGGGLPCVDVKSYAARLHAWARSGRPQAGERAQAILDEMIYKEKIYNRVCFNLCITAWALSGHPEQAEKVLWNMMDYSHECIDQDKDNTRSTEMQPDHGSFIAAINGWRISNDPRSAERAENLISCMQNLCNIALQPANRYNSTLMNGNDGYRELLPTTTSLNAVLDTWAEKRNNGPKVEGLLRRMETTVSHPSLETYTIAIKAWALTTDVMAEEAPEQRAEALLEELEDLSKAGHDDLTPNVIAYTATIQAWANSRQRDAPMRALSLLRRMQRMSRRRRGGSDGPRQECAAPNLHAYNTVLYTFAQHGLALDAERLFDEMKDLALHGRDASMSPNSMSYNNLLHAHVNNGLDNSPDRCRELLLEMEMGLDEGNERIKPTPATYCAVIKACGNHSGDDAEVILWRMQERYEKAMTNGCHPPTTRVCNSLLRVWANSGEGMAPQRAESILRWMQDQYSKGLNDNVQPDRISFELVIKAWDRSRRRRAIEHVEQLVEEMKSKERQILSDSLSLETL